MKQTKSEKVVIDNTTFYVRPFGAFTAAGMTARLGKILGPVLGSVAPIITDFMDGEDGKTKKIEEMDFGAVAEGIGGALASVDPDGLVDMLKMLLTDHRNVAFSVDGEEPSTLDEDIANGVFCQDLSAMIAVAVAVIKINFSGFFGKFAARYGIHFEKMGAAIRKSMDTSTSPNLATSS